MMGLLDIIDEYFADKASGETEQERYWHGYGRMTNCLDRLCECTTISGYDIDSLDSLFDEAMMEEYGYIYKVQLTNGDEVECHNVYDVADIVSGTDDHYSYDDLIYDLESLGCDDCIYLNGCFIMTVRNW